MSGLVEMKAPRRQSLFNWTSKFRKKLVMTQSNLKYSHVRTSPKLGHSFWATPCMETLPYTKAIVVALREGQSWSPTYTGTDENCWADPPYLAWLRPRAISLNITEMIMSFPFVWPQLSMLLPTSSAKAFSPQALLAYFPPDNQFWVVDLLSHVHETHYR